MPKDFLFPPLTGASRKIALTANSPFAPNMLGAIVDLGGFQLNLTGATGYGFFILTGPGTITGAATATLGPTQAMMIAVENGVFHFIDQPDIDLSALNAQLAGKAPLASPNFTGIPLVDTAAQGTSTRQAASTAFVTAGLAGKSNQGHTHTFSGVDGLQAAFDSVNSTLASKANTASPQFSGAPLAPTAAPGTNTTQIATTAFVIASISGLSGGSGTSWGLIGGTITAQGDLQAALNAAKTRSNHTGFQDIGTITNLQSELNARAPLASPNFSGIPLVDTAAPGTNTRQAASTAFVKQLGDTKSPLASPNFSGIPLVDTASPGTNTRQAASTAFVQAAVSNVSGGAGLPVLTRSAEQGSPTGVGENPATMANHTIRLITSSGISVTGGTQTINRDYIYIGGNEWNAVSAPAEERVYFLDGYWYITHRNLLAIALATGGAPLVFRAAGTIADDPSSLTYTHAPGSGGSGGAWVITPISGEFAGTPGILTPAGLGQKCRVGPYALTGTRTEIYDWFLAESLSPVLWRQIDEVHPLQGTIGNTAPENGAAASITINPDGADNSITYTAVTPGTAGNSITIAYAAASLTHGTTITPSVVNNAITITPRKRIITVSGLVSPAANGDYIFVSSTELQGAAHKFIRAAVLGTPNKKRWLLQTNANSTIWQSAEIDDTDVTSNYAPDAAHWEPWTAVSGSTGSPVFGFKPSLASEVITAVNASVAASALVTATASGADTGSIAPVATTSLSGGSTADTGPPFIRVHGGFLYIQEAGTWKKTALSTL